MMYLGDNPVGLNTAHYIDFNPFKYCASTYRMFREKELPQNIIVDFEGNYPSRGMEEMFYGCTNWNSITIKNLTMPEEGLNTAYMFNGCDNCDTIIFDNCRIRPSTCGRMFTSGYNGVKRIIGPIDLTKLGNSSTDPFYFARVLQHFELVPNTALKAINMTGMGGVFDDETLVSIGNAMNADYPSTQSNMAKYNARMQALNGNNINGLFVADENGTLSLYDFITTIKGWTITN